MAGKEVQYKTMAMSSQCHLLLFTMAYHVHMVHHPFCEWVGNCEDAQGIPSPSGLPFHSHVLKYRTQFQTLGNLKRPSMEKQARAQIDSHLHGLVLKTAQAYLLARSWSSTQPDSGLKSG